MLNNADILKNESDILKTKYPLPRRIPKYFIPARLKKTHSILSLKKY